MHWQKHLFGTRGGRAGRAAAVAGGAVLVAGMTGGVSSAAVSGAGAPPHAAAPAAAAQPAGDGPGGFWYGTDSRTITIGGSAPYREPVIGGAYGGYIGMAGNWANWICGHKLVVWSGTNSAQANTNFSTYRKGIGTGVYWFMGGPGVDPHYNGTASEAYAWGQRQAARTLWAASHVHVTYPVIFMDIEIPGNAPNYTPASDNGWNTVYTSACSGRARAHYIPASVDRADFNGFFDYVKHHGYRPGVYSAPGIWASIFGSGGAAQIPHTYEWTYESFTSSLAHHPYGWCLSGTSTCARFFGGQTSGSPSALMWQWSGGGGSSNGYGDFDQIDGNRTPAR